MDINNNFHLYTFTHINAKMFYREKSMGERRYFLVQISIEIETE